ncbi:hypothetical protein LO762_29120 [Actinocorallia sp. API 0066]|nr:hypothetical protein [Actinocorallia sp. API 0066]MCD0453213.1 hypothetical protein [Actinocorallia sp. API 0066]
MGGQDLAAGLVAGAVRRAGVVGLAVVLQGAPVDGVAEVEPVARRRGG